MANTEPLLDLLRTNSISRYLFRRVRNDYVKTLREVLNDLGYGSELNWDRLGADTYYGEETVSAVRSFLQRNKLQGDGGQVAPQAALQLVRNHEGLEGISMVQRAMQQQQLLLAFNLNDPKNYGAQKLGALLEIVGIAEASVTQSLQRYAQVQGLYSDGRQFTEPLARALLQDLLPRYGSGINLNVTPQKPPVEPVPPIVASDLKIVESENNVLVSDGSLQIQFRRHPVGVSTFGYHTVSNYVDNNRRELQELDISQVALDVIEAVAENEGRLDGINTYDRGYLSLGVYQWTLGSDDRAGELPALLKKIKTNFPATFRSFFTNFGVDVSEDTNTTYGFLTYNGVAVASSTSKDGFRVPEWAFRFWRSAQDANVQAIQVQHAISRLKNFYWKPNFSVMGYPLNTVITSAYGVALILDNHVNRPAWVAKCVEQAMRVTGLSSPIAWTDAEENRLIQAYLDIRETYSENGYSPMSKSRERAEKIYGHVRAGTLSDRRGSFTLTESAIKSYDALPGDLRSAVPNSVPPPPFYAPQDYPDIEMDL